MKINLDTKNQDQNVDKLTTSKNTPSYHKADIKGAIALDISGTVMDNKAYGDHGRTTEDVMLSADAQFDVSLQRNYMTVMSNSMSGEDFNKMLEKGFDPSDLDVDKVVTIVDHIKATLAKSGEIINGYNDNLSIEKLTQITGNQSYAQKIEGIMKQSDVPITVNNVKDIKKALDKTSEIMEFKDGSVKYMVENNLEPTVENIYLASYSACGDGSKQANGYYAQEMPGYYAKKANEINWNQLFPQIEKSVSEMNLTDISKEDQLNDAKWLVMKGIPVTEDTINSLQNIRQIEFPILFEKVVTAAVTAISEGKPADKGNLLPNTDSIFKQAVTIKEQTDSIKDEELYYAIQNENKLNLKTLFKYHNSDLSDTDIDKSNVAFISSKRILEEVRLQMTIDANTRLLKKGISIDTTGINELVEQLKKQESELKNSFFGEGSIKDLDEKASLYKNTTSILEEIPYLPAAVIGRRMVTKDMVSLSYVHQTGSELKAKYEAAGTSYEALMTVPRKDMGDNIQKAFQNVDAILEDLQLDCSGDNQKAVRILAYNNMAIDKESIDRVKNADKQIENVIKSMSPAKTLKLIRDGKNPLTMSLDEIEQEIKKMDMDPIKDTEKFSKYLYDLDRNKEITESERNAYIGVYRLFHQIEKSDGAAVGNLVATGAEVTIGNLLSAVRSRKAKTDVEINDEFGVLTNTIKKGASISTQIEEGVFEARLAHSVYRDLTPQSLKNIKANEDTKLTEIQESINNQKGVEKETSFNQQSLDALKESMNVDDTIIDTLTYFNQPVTANKITATDALMNNRGSLFSNTKKYAKKVDEHNSMQMETIEDKSLEELLLSTSENMIQKFTDKDSAINSYQNMTDTIKDVLDQAMDYVIDQTIDIKAISSCYKQLALSSSLSKQENFEIPVVIGDGITSINLCIQHDKSKKGMVTTSFESETFGKVSAQFTVKNHQISALFITDNKDGIDRLKAVGEVMSENLISQGKEVKNMNYITGNPVNPVTFLKNTDDIDTEPVSTSDLYQIAKSYLNAFHTDR